MKTKGKAHKVEFGAPPPQRRDYHWAEVAEQLRQNPGEWAVVHRDLPASVCWTVNAGKVRAVHPSLGFQTRTTGNHADGPGIRWVRELWMVYDPTLDTSKAKKNGVKK